MPFSYLIDPLSQLVHRQRIHAASPAESIHALDAPEVRPDFVGNSAGLSGSVSVAEHKCNAYYRCNYENIGPLSTIGAAHSGYSILNTVDLSSGFKKHLPHVQEASQQSVFIFGTHDIVHNVSVFCIHRNMRLVFVFCIHCIMRLVFVFCIHCIMCLEFVLCIHNSVYRTFVFCTYCFVALFIVHSSARCVFQFFSNKCTPPQFLKRGTNCRL